MTRLAILSDMHGNLPALEAVLSDLSQFKIDRVIVPGDVINWGPFSAQVVDRVAREGWAVIRGNNEFYLLDYDTPRAPEAWTDRNHFSMLPWLAGQLNGRRHDIIATWPDTLHLRFPDAPPIRVVHGSPRSNREPIYPISAEADVEAMLAGVEETTVIAGHTHLAMDRCVGRWHILNPGSIGVPIDGRPGASYMLLEGNESGWHATIRRADFDDAPLFAEFERQNFIEECGVIAHLVLEEFKTHRLHIHPFVHWRSACRPDAAVDMNLLAEFKQIDPWPYIPPAFHVNLPGLAGF